MARVKSNMATIYRCEGLRLLPGINTVDKAALDKALKNKGFQARIDEKAIEVVKGGAEGGGSNNDNGLPTDGLGVKEAKEVVAEIFDIPSLEEIVEKETRKGVRDAAAAQIAKIREEDGDDE